MIVLRNVNLTKTTPNFRSEVARQLHLTIANASSFALVFSSRTEIADFALGITCFADLEEFVLSGQFLVDDADLANPLTLKNRRAVEQRVQVISRELLSPFNQDLPLSKVFEFLLRQRGGNAPFEIVDHLHFVQLDDSVLELPISALSDFQRVKVLILLASMTQARFLIIEELEVALDDAELDVILQIVRQYQIHSGASCLFLTTDIAWALAECDAVGIMQAGLLLESGSIAEVSRKAMHPMTLAMSRGEFPASFAPVGCPYAVSCKAKARVSENLCATTLPISISITDTHMVRCHLSAEERLAYANEVSHGTP